MTKRFYLISGLGPGFDGILVEGEPYVAETNLVAVLRFIDNDIVVGDRPLITPVTPGMLIIDGDALTEVENPTIREFDSNNPYGKFQLEGRMKCGNIEVAYSQFERALQVNVTDQIDTTDRPMVPGPTATRTLLAVNFTNPMHFKDVKELIETSLSTQDEADQLVFKLEEARDRYNG